MTLNNQFIDGVFRAYHNISKVPVDQRSAGDIRYFNGMAVKFLNGLLTTIDRDRYDGAKIVEKLEIL